MIPVAASDEDSDGIEQAVWGNAHEQFFALAHTSIDGQATVGTGKNPKSPPISVRTVLVAR